MPPDPTQNEPLPDPPGSWFARNRKLAVLLGIAALLLAAAFVTALWRNRGDQTGGENTDDTAVVNQTGSLSNRETFIRYPAVIATDADSDGLTDDEEEALGTDPALADSDGDGLTDSEESAIYQTDPLKQDTDGDGRGDGQEVAANENPNGGGQLRDLDQEIKLLTNQ